MIFFVKSKNNFIYLDGVRLSASHVKFVVTHAKSQDSLVDPQPEIGNVYKYIITRPGHQHVKKYLYLST